jgi:hypothetical protein
MGGAKGREKGQEPFLLNSRRMAETVPDTNGTAGWYGRVYGDVFVKVGGRGIMVW